MAITKNVHFGLRILALASLFAGGVYGQSLSNMFPFPNGSGFLETFNLNHTDIPMDGPFFQPLGSNGRSCSTCHQPDQGWSISPAQVRLRFLLTQGTDPIFRTVDGSNCDHNVNTTTVEGRRRAYTLLVSRGLIRIALPPPAGAEFSVVSVRNPYGCDEMQTLSMYRRPLPSTNLRYLTTVMWDGRESSAQTSTQKIGPSTNPGDLMADLTHQAMDAVSGHAQGTTVPTAQQLQDIVNFEMSLRTAQAIDFRAGPLDDGGATGGPAAIASLGFFVGINDSFPPSLGLNPTGAAFNPSIFNLFAAWADSKSHAKASVARGEILFNTKPIQISGVAGVNDTLGIETLTGTCGTCHDSPNLGHHSVSVPLNIGVGDPTLNPLDLDYLPIITLQNNKTGARIDTTDPGRAMVSGAWADIGKVKGPILRGLAARAPYFHNGSAATLNDVITFYDKRFDIEFTPQERADLLAFLKSL